MRCSSSPRQLRREANRHIRPSGLELRTRRCSAFIDSSNSCISLTLSESGSLTRKATRPGGRPSAKSLRQSYQHPASLPTPFPLQEWLAARIPCLPIRSRSPSATRPLGCRGEIAARPEMFGLRALPANDTSMTRRSMRSARGRSGCGNKKGSGGLFPLRPHRRWASPTRSLADTEEGPRPLVPPQSRQVANLPHVVSWQSAVRWSLQRRHQSRLQEHQSSGDSLYG